MRAGIDTEVGGNLLRELSALEALLMNPPSADLAALEEEVSDLEALVRTAGIPSDEPAREALHFLQRELEAKRLQRQMRLI